MFTDVRTYLPGSPALRAACIFEKGEGEATYGNRWHVADPYVSYEGLTDSIQLGGWIET